ncbi:L-histidine N(alpha)-methyltransferase [Aspergillus clavatus NRRL 1]|uniref:Histidine-specific methyltransferase SAM-dependent domain-containing protein n=1 Tax=Aspergillus clavatus (strain ATCC 1007 / CBS 513.65 / DSM 816 / NCTC 3887 / NRRL 1 / QM 1276 / 107) TaxID=344612 RepID=A1C5F7_ASPCL|nr:uncharacterized protein ACLA_003380 [Aspergillus clavatus NRRL 1]EAW14925.1 conserved hypothetical protein [Aspergillus clavatus NRRL 1]
MRFQSSTSYGHVIDIRSESGTATGRPLQDELLDSLRGGDAVQSVSDGCQPPIEWSRSIPTSVLYEGRGIDLYENITRDPAYYLYRDEFSIFQRYSQDIATALLRPVNAREAKSLIKPESSEDTHLILVDLVLTKYRRRVDIQHEQLQRRIDQLVRQRPEFSRGHVDTSSPMKLKSSISAQGICGSYYDAMGYLASGGLVDETPELKHHGGPFRKCLMWLGSSFTNMKPTEAARFLRQFTRNGVLQPGDLMLVGIDRCRQVDKVMAAYSVSSPSWQRYVQNGMRNAAEILQEESLVGDWEYVARWDAAEGRHVRFAKSTRPRALQSRETAIPEGEHVFLAQSYKYTRADATSVFEAAGLQLLDEWVNADDDCSLFLLENHRD